MEKYACVDAQVGGGNSDSPRVILLTSVIMHVLTERIEVKGKCGIKRKKLIGGGGGKRAGLYIRLH